LLSAIWTFLLVSGIAIGLLRGKGGDLTQILVKAAHQGAETILSLSGVILFWMGIARIAERSGLAEIFSRLVSPLLRRLFPEIPTGHPALGAIAMNVSANLLGLGHAATPFGLKAMEELQKLNPEKDRATDSMVTFLVLNTAGLSLFPVVVVGLRAQYGSQNPADIVVPAFLATCASTLCGLLADRWLRGRKG